MTTPDNAWTGSGEAAAPLDFRSLFEKVPACCMVLAPDLTILAATDAYLAVTMTQRDEIIGRGLFDVFPENEDERNATGMSNLQASLDRVLRHRVPDTMAVQKYDIQRPESEGGGYEVRYWSPVNHPVIADDGTLTCIIHRAEDVTEFLAVKPVETDRDDVAAERNVRLEREIVQRGQELQEANRRLRSVGDAAAEAAHVGSFDWDVAQNVVRWSDELFRIYGLDPAQAETTVDAFLGCVHRDDLTAVRGVLDAALRNGGSFEMEASIVRPSGEVRTLSTSGEVVTDDGRKRVLGVSHDVTEHRATERERGETEARLRLLVESVTDYAIFMLTPAGDIISWNTGAERLYGYTPDEAIGHDCSRFYTADDIEAGKPLREIQIATDVGRVEDEHWRVRKDGTRFWANVVMTAIRNPEGELRGYAKVIRDLTQRKLAEDNLRESEAAVRAARDEAVQASLLKSQFLANMSHEIRTPMNGVLGIAQLLLADETDAAKRDRLLVMRESGQHLLAIIDGILDFSRIEAGKLELADIDFDLRAVVEGAASMLRSEASDMAIAFEVDIAPAVPLWVRGDPGRLRQILINLIGNAVKFTDIGGVVVRVAPGDGDVVRFEVTDTGVGIDPLLGASILEPFSQADPSTTRRFGGTGLGLAICRQLAELMGGTLNYESTQGGTTFTLAVPLQQAAVQDRAPAPDGKVTINPARSKSFADTGRSRVLLVEDNPLNRLVARTMLERLGYEVDAATNGVEAVDAVIGGHYDVILMDCLMPVMDGYEATERIRRLDPPSCSTPIVAATASAMAADREKCLESGMDDYLSKPFDIETLACALERWCTREAESA